MHENASMLWSSCFREAFSHDHLGATVIILIVFWFLIDQLRFLIFGGLLGKRIWNDAMKLSLQAINKFGFVDELQETYDKVDGSVVYNLLQKVNTIKQGGSSVADYYHRLNSLWREFDALTKIPKCVCEPVRSAFLTRDPLPDVKDAYNIVSRGESDRGIPESFGTFDAKLNATSFVAKTFNNNRRNLNTNNNTRGLFPNNNNNRGPNNNGKIVEKLVTLLMNAMRFPSSPSGFTPEQMEKLLNLINDNRVGNFHANMIIDSGANQHLTFSTVGMINVVDVTTLSINVGHPNGNEYDKKQDKIRANPDKTEYKTESAPRSPEYVPDPIELEDHVPLHILEHPEDEAYILKVASAPTPPLPPSFLSQRMRPLHTRAAMARMRAAVPSTYHSLLPSKTPPLLPIPLHVPSTSRITEIPEADMPPQKRLLLTAHRPGCEVEESSVAAATNNHRNPTCYQYQFFRLEKDNPRDHIRWGSPSVARKRTPHYIHTWENLVSKFINEFFPPLRTTNLRNEILNFQQRFDDSFHKAWDRYKDLLRACPHHGFTELHQLDTFYNALNPADQDSLNAAAGGNLLERRTQDVLTIIENKSKVHNSRNKSVVSRVKSCNANSNSSSEIAKLTHAVNQQTSAVTTTMTTILKQFQATPPPASVKAVEETCVTCGGAHPYYQCLAACGNTFLELRDNIQGHVLAVAVNYYQGNAGYRPPCMANQIQPPGFAQPNVQNNQNCFGQPQGFNRGTNYNPQSYLTQEQSYQAPTQQNKIVPLNELEKVKRMNEDNMKAMQTQINIVKNELRNEMKNSIQASLSNQTNEIKNMMVGLFQMNTASTSGSGPLPSNTVANPKEEDERVKETLTDPNLFEYTIKVPPLPLHINITLADALILMPKYQKMLKALLSNKEKLQELANTPLNENCLASLLILGRPFLRTARALIDVHGEEMILHDGDERLTLNMRHDTSSYSNQPKKESINIINVFNNSSEYFLEDLFLNQPSGNPTFSSHPKLTSSEVNIFDSKRGNVLPEKLLDLDYIKDLHPPLHDNPLSCGTTNFSSSNPLLEEFADELSLITFPLKYDDDL
uniref:Retrotransposon gag domain-containing protein n=1 Tax=Tanacetum cinerariifolium TaxID=118510 RepID=A0A6L2JSI3_TANCI|nr:hypothetical protein [Tanacetum cinerariifolium]